MKVSNIKRIVVEDFPSDQQQLVSGLGTALNPMLEQLSQVFDKNIDFDNLNQQLVTMTMKVNASGIPEAGYNQFTHGLSSRPKGIICISARPIDGTSFPTSAPFVSFGYAGGSYQQIVIQHISGLQSTATYEIVMIVIG